MRKELPIKYLEEPKQLDRGTCSEVSEFRPEKEKKYVIKEIGQDAWELGRYPGDTLHEKAASMKKVYDILKECYRDNIANTYFILAKNKEDKPCIMKIQEKIEGIRLDELQLKKDDPGYRKVCEKALKQFNKINDIFLDKACPKLKQLGYDFNTTELIRDEITKVYKNLIVDRKGKCIIIDW